MPSRKSALPALACPRRLFRCSPYRCGTIWALSMFWKHLQFSNIFSNTFLNGVSIILEHLWSILFFAAFFDVALGIRLCRRFFSVNSLRSQNRLLLLLLRINCIVSRCSTLCLLIQLRVRMVRYESFSRSEVSTSSYNRLQALQTEIQSTPSLPRCPREL